tara:strand:- start:91 stop:228 length:138 start_codon:yes stop_codon:yes gene_type:complete
MKKQQELFGTALARIPEQLRELPTDSSAQQRKEEQRLQQDTTLQL